MVAIGPLKPKVGVQISNPQPRPKAVCRSGVSRHCYMKRLSLYCRIVQLVKTSASDSEVQGSSPCLAATTWQCSEVANTWACKALIVRSNRTTASIWFHSSVGQNSRLITGLSKVRVLVEPPYARIAQSVERRIYAPFGTRLVRGSGFESQCGHHRRLQQLFDISMLKVRVFLFNPSNF